MKKCRISIIFLIIVSLAFSLKSASKSDNVDDVLTRILKRKVIYLALESMFTGENALSFRDVKTGEYKGLEIDLAKEIAKDLGVELKFVPTKWDRISEAVRLNKADIGMQQLFIPKKESLSGKEAYSEAYMESGLAILYRSGENEPQFKDLKKVQIGILNDDIAIKYVQSQGVNQLRVFDSEAKMFDCLLVSQCDYVVSDRPLVSAFVKNYPGKALISQDDLPGSKEGYGIVMRIDAIELQKKINETVIRWKNSPRTQEEFKKNGLDF